MNTRNIMLILSFIFILFLSSCSQQEFEAPLLDEPYLLVSHVKEPAFSYINLNTHEKIGSFKQPYPLTNLISLAPHELLATSQQHNAILHYDLLAGTIEPVLTINKGLTDLVYNEIKNQLYVTDIQNNVIHIINALNYSVEETIEVGQSPTELSLDQDNQLLYVLNLNSHSLVIIDLENMSIKHEFDVIDRPSGLFIKNNLVWVGGHGPYGDLNRHIYGYDIATGELIEKIEVGLMPIAMYGDEQEDFIYILCHGDHILTKIDTTTNTLINTVSVGQNPNYLTSNNRSIYVTNLDSNTVSIIDKNTFTVETITVQEGPLGMILEDRNDG
ncbi:YncE family protein [Alkalihalobacillus trypoxylicola]|uniref:YncE family protein n=1 Tax=Alkalihalobacillus trypoxylicola TaxID=519424 RepID=A0A162CTA4_9BACI|nr:YncE family protein [Alkalihalobacillus trypoxylicola]KYG26564.1 hypothetical protein AZF04_12185 [Alkalihalobacillus trypoxylicola]